MNRFENVDVLAALEQLMRQNTAFYQSDFEIDKERSWMIGDSDSDVEAGRKYGVRTIKTNDLGHAVKKILAVDESCRMDAILPESGRQEDIS